jgi:nitrogen-specific signal transduction histidine kinase/ActR/RegA family two-component response regulator
LEFSLDDEGLPLYATGTCQDITDSRRAQEQFFATQKLESVGTLAGGIAHDFNNILGGVVATAELALAELQAGQLPEDELQKIRDLGVRGAEIVRQLMIYSGKESPDLELVDVSAIVMEMVKLLRVSVSKHASLETNLAAGLPGVRANAAQVRQIVMNLVTNASEAIGERDGVIRVTTSRLSLDAAAAENKGLREGEYLQLEVSDTGHGIPVETQARVFDPFFTTKSNGRGLGLAVVHGIARNVGGSVSVASMQGAGTTFSILLPAADGVVRALSPAPEYEVMLPLRQQATVLVVEDEGPLRDAVAKMLRKKGFEILEAEDGNAAIKLLQSGTKIDILLLDMTIPGVSSREVADEAARLHPDSRIVLTSAYSEETVVASFTGPLVSGFIRKPFRLEHLVQTLGKVLSNRSSGVSAAL